MQEKIKQNKCANTRIIECIKKSSFFRKVWSIYVKGSKKMLKEAYFSLECHSVAVSLGTYTLEPDMDMVFGGCP